MKQSRRDFFKAAGLLGAGITGLKTKDAHAGSGNILSEDRMGVLVDATVCVGCRKCEFACKTAHDLPTEPIETYDDRSVFKEMRRPDESALTVVNEYENPKNANSPINVKVQCMHCDYPACVSACVVGALTKAENGSVIYDPDICMGCRYCLVVCPFQGLAYEYLSPLTPKVMKCDLCFDRTKEGKIPACVEMCPMEALTYGKRSDLLKLAHKRIKENPEKYIDHVYGEFEVGGTSWLYLANNEFAGMDLPDLNIYPVPQISETIQHGVFKYFIPPVSLYALLGGIMWLNKKKDENEESQEGGEK